MEERHGDLMEGIPAILFDFDVYLYDGVYAVVAHERRVLDIVGKEAVIELIEKLQEALKE